MPADALHDQAAEETARVLRQSQSEMIQVIPFLDGTLSIHSNVFSPAYFEDTFFFAESIPIREGESFLEVGTGTGAIAIALAKRGKNGGLALDLNLDAVCNAQRNIKEYGLDQQIDVRQSDVFDAVKSGERFDLLFWNVPFADRIATDILEHAVFDRGYQAIERYVQGARALLRPGGRLFIGFSDTLGKLSTLQDLGERYRYRLEKIATARCREGVLPVSMDLYQLTEVL